MAKYDVPSTIDYILNTTGQARLFYIGHSQGTLIAFASFSTQPEIAKKVKLFIALAPIADIGHIKSRLLMDLAHITATVEVVYYNELLL